MSEKPAIERRRHSRKPDRIQARVAPPHVKDADAENALIEEVSANGMRILSGAPIREDESFCIYVNGESRPLQARAMWVRKQGFIEKRKTGKSGQAYVVGCKLLEKPESKTKEKARGAAARRAENVRENKMASRVGWGMIIGGGIALLGVLGYGAYTLIKMMQMQ